MSLVRFPLHPRMAWPPAAVVLVVLLGVRALHTAARPGEGTLTANAFLLARTGDGLQFAALSPGGVGTLHVTVYAAITRAFERHATLPTAGRELFLLVASGSAVLLWSTARRLSLTHAAAAAAVLLAAVPLVLGSVALIDVPASLAVPWLLAAWWLVAPGRPTDTARVLALLSLTMAVLLAPGLLLLALAGATAAVLTGRPTRHPGVPLRPAAAVGLATAFLVTAVLGRRWSALAGTPALDLGSGTVRLAVGAYLLAGGLAAWRLRRLRVAATALVAATAAAALSSASVAVPTLLACLPVAAVLTAGLLEDLARVAAGTPAIAGAGRGPAVAGNLAAAVALLAAAIGSVVLPVGQAQRPTSTPSAVALQRWATEELPGDAALAAPARIRAELIHAGVEERRVRPPGAADTGGRAAPVLTVTDGGTPAGHRVVARFDGPGSARPLVVLDSAPGTPTADELRRRRSLAAAVLANPATSAGNGAAEVLRSGEVDLRLLSLLAAMATRGGVGVAAFPVPPGTPDVAPPARRVLVDSLSGEPLLPGTPATRALVAWLDAQLPPFAPDLVEVTDGGVLIGFDYVSAPDALVTGSAP